MAEPTARPQLNIVYKIEACYRYHLYNGNSLIFSSGWVETPQGAVLLGAGDNCANPQIPLAQYYRLPELEIALGVSSQRQIRVHGFLCIFALPAQLSQKPNLVLAVKDGKDAAKIPLEPKTVDSWGEFMEAVEAAASKTSTPAEIMAFFASKLGGLRGVSPAFNAPARIIRFGNCSGKPEISFIILADGTSSRLFTQLLTIADEQGNGNTLEIVCVTLSPNASNEARFAVEDACSLTGICATLLVPQISQSPGEALRQGIAVATGDILIFSSDGLIARHSGWLAANREKLATVNENGCFYCDIYELSAGNAQNGLGAFRFVPFEERNGQFFSPCRWLAIRKNELAALGDPNADFTMLEMVLANLMDRVKQTGKKIVRLDNMSMIDTSTSSARNGARFFNEAVQRGSGL